MKSSNVVALTILFVVSILKSSVQDLIKILVNTVIQSLFLYPFDMSTKDLHFLDTSEWARFTCLNHKSIVSQYYLQTYQFAPFHDLSATSSVCQRHATYAS